ncbi:histidine phosphotransferase family protein [Rhodosalinus sp.]|uniref:histidine phosphotransferase family protein n=1 Tax=Rhodosalinus sp. TaxID=2047741 RepID=UPI00397E8FD7
MSVLPAEVPKQPSADLAALTGARICHDLVSPVGAISNGLELLSLSPGAPVGPEMELIAESCASAQARLGFYRVAFGKRSVSEVIGSGDAAALVQGHFADTRLEAAWAAEGALPRAEVQLAFLALLCVETALPRGGAVRVARQGGRWELTGEGPRVAADPALVAVLQGAGGTQTLTPAQVQFALLALHAVQAGRQALAEADARRIALSV